MGLPFYIVDVFAERKYAGNQLAVFPEAGGLTTEQMQAIAREVNYSETTFVLPQHPGQNAYPVRIFTPTQELPFAGHPTLGTAFVVQQTIAQSPIETMILQLQVGDIPVTLTYPEQTIGDLWMRQNAPIFGQTFAPAAIAAILNLAEPQLDDCFEIQEVSTGVPFIIVPLKNQAALQQAKVDRGLFFQLVATTAAQAMLVFCPETQQVENDLSVRVFADGLGIAEDPATGSANGCLAGYLLHHGYLGADRIDIRVEQGYQMGRPALLKVRAQWQGDTIGVSVGGQVILVAKGEFV